MRVEIANEAGDVLWMKDETGGIASRGYLKDGTQEQIVLALRRALEQAEFELESVYQPATS